VETGPGIWPLTGGIEPPDEKALSNATPIREAPLVERYLLPLAQHAGAPAKPCVQVGDRVLGGALVADADGPVSVALHAPTSGRIVAIEARPVPHPSGLDAPCIELEADGEDRSIDPAPLPGWADAAPEHLLERIARAGIAGLGGAGFPTAVKARRRAETPITTLILNGAECEPYITADDRLMRERADGILRGLAILAHLVQPERCLIGIEDNKPEAIRALRDALAHCPAPMHGAPELVVIPTRYPSGGERQLIEILTGRQVPAGGLPAHIGMLCVNVGTAWAVHRAIEQGDVLRSRITTVTGRALARPGNFEVRIGTPFSALLDAAGADLAAVDRVIMGGPMMGFTVPDTAVPVVKTTNCILVPSPADCPPPPPEQPCIRCGFCAEVCPASLLPQQLYWHARARDLEAARDHDLADCIECGACAWVCPSAIPLVQYYRFAKGELRDKDRERQQADRARERFEAHQARLEQEAREKAARRQARAGGRKRPDAQDGDARAAAVEAAVARVRARREAASGIDASASEADAARPNATLYDSAGDEAQHRRTAVDDASATSRPEPTPPKPASEE
jgi:electron transport complex protein RnfC